MLSFEVRGEYIELIQLMKVLDIAETGGQAKQMVEDGLVKVNGVVESRKRAKLRPGDRIEVRGRKVLLTGSNAAAEEPGD